MGCRSVEPVLPTRREDIDVDRILSEDEFMRNMMWPAFIMYLRPCE
jgi:hypothetical protein